MAAHLEVEVHAPVAEFLDERVVLPGLGQPFGPFVPAVGLVERLVVLGAVVAVVVVPPGQVEALVRLHDAWVQSPWYMYVFLILYDQTPFVRSFFQLVAHRSLCEL